jgi:hypothetical protein
MKTGILTCRIQKIGQENLLNLNKSINNQVSAFVFTYKNHMYSGVIDKGATILAVTRSLKAWKWPVCQDELFYEWEDTGGISSQRLSKQAFFQYS